MPLRLSPISRLLFLLALSALPFIAACSNDGPASAKGDEANDAKASPTLDMPVSRYSVTQVDLGINFLVDIKGTFDLDSATYAKSASFDTESDGKKLLAEWKYLGGYETGYIPELREQAVLQGAYYIKLESHLFKDEAGAKKAFTYIDNRLKGKSGNEPVTGTAAPVGNQYVAYKRLDGKVANTAVNALYHHYVFRRGNFVAVVFTYGAEGFINVDKSVQIARIIDSRALGKAESEVPTPTSNYTPAAASSGTVPAPAATRTPSASTTATRQQPQGGGGANSNANTPRPSQPAATVTPKP